MLGMPAETAYDVRFRLLGIPVRVTPWFWVITALLGVQSLDPGDKAGVVTWIGCVFVSILVHEMGHGLTAKWFGYRAEIALYQMGGLCSSEGERQTPNQKLAVLANGPGSQFVLLGIVCLLGWLILGVSWRADLLIGKLYLRLPLTPDMEALQEVITKSTLHPRMWRIFEDMFQINLIWPLLNLVPIFPLDGGQITQVIMAKLDPRDGARRSHIVSMVTAGILAAYVYIRNRDSSGMSHHIILVLFLLQFAYMNYQYLQAYQKHYSSWGRDDSDWWKR